MANTRTEMAFTPIIASTLVHCSQGEDLYDAQWHSSLWHNQAQTHAHTHAHTLVCGSACPVVKHYAIMRPTMVLAQWMHAWVFHHRFHILCRADAVTIPYIFYRIECIVVITYHWHTKTHTCGAIIHSICTRIYAHTHTPYCVYETHHHVMVI